MALAMAISANAATKGRIMTNGKVTMYKNGQAVTSYSKQGPIDENALMACDGTCMVKLKGVSLIGIDQTRFAVKESADTLDLFVDQGKINFAVSDISQQFAFYAPNGYFVKTEGFIAPASTEKSVKGFMQVNEKTTVIGMESGTMVVMTDKGSQTINPGQSIVLAMAAVPDQENSAGTDPRKGGWFWNDMSTSQQVVTVAAGAGMAAGIAYLTFWYPPTSDNFVPPPVVPEPIPPPPASPNR